jgi:hypothetical protein
MEGTAHLTARADCLIVVAVADWSGQAWLQGFNDAGVTVFGCIANSCVTNDVRSPIYQVQFLDKEWRTVPIANIENVVKIWCLDKNEHMPVTL